MTGRPFDVMHSLRGLASSTEFRLLNSPLTGRSPSADSSSWLIPFYSDEQLPSLPFLHRVLLLKASILNLELQS